jgi:MtrB/PioB family decaheme-associated outer membrane protein
MRSRLLAGTSLLLLSAGVAAAQTPPTPQPPPKPPAQPAAPAPVVDLPGSIDFGFRGTGTDVDAARYERYRDLRDGAASLFQFKKETDTYFANADAFNVGYRDQRYRLDYERSKMKFGFLWDSIPTNFSELTVSPWDVGDDGVLSIDAAVRQQVQSRTAVGVPCAPGAPPAACGNPTQAAAALANRSIYNVDLPGFEIRSRRDTAAFGLSYAAKENVDVNLKFATTGRSGHQPWGASFAFNNANEVPLPMDNRTNDISAGVEWSHQKGMFRLGWDGSFFANDVDTLIWDNPIRATDFNNGLQPPNGPYDPSGYSNGNGPARGRMALWPDNSMNVFSVMGLYKLPRRSSFNGTLQFTNQSQDAELIDWTINPLIDQQSVFAVFPNLAALPRNTAEAEVQGLNALLNFNSRPINRVSFNVRYRYNDRDVQTPSFDATEYVRFDAVPEDTGSPTHQFDITRQTFDATVTYSLNRWGAVRAGYGHDQYERHGRGFSDVGDNIFRVSYDAFANQYFTVRAAYEGSRRRGDGFIESGIDYEGVGGTQEGLRYYDEADRNRHRASITVGILPTDLVDLSLTYMTGRDEYVTDEFTPGRGQFGLLDADTDAFTVSLNFVPRAELALGAAYGRETYAALQQSRNAAPLPSAEWTDPTRDWTLDQDEAVNTITLYADVLKAIKNTDIRIAYEFMDSDNDFVHGGPRIQQLNTNTSVTGSACSAGVSDCFIPLPPVTTNWNRFAADVKYFFRPQVGIGFGYRYEKLDVTDFATIDSNGSLGFTDATDVVRTDYLGGLITGYNPRNYRGHSTFLRLLYLF